MTAKRTFPEDFPVAAKWPPEHPERLQLYTLGTPNGIKPVILLEECGMPYEYHEVSFKTGDQKTPEFLSLNPYGKIPAMIDPDGPEGPLPLFESGAMLIYIAEKAGQFLPSGAARWEALEWLMFQVGGQGPMFGQLGFFHKFDGREIEDPRPKARYVEQSRKVLQVMDDRLAGREWFLGEGYSIADISMLGWVRNLIGFYGAREVVGFDDFGHVARWLEAGLDRPAVRRAYEVAG